MAPTLTRMDARPIPERAGEIRGCMVVRNDHCRRLGVERFLVVDNGSDDGTLDFLLAQADLHVFSSTDGFAANSMGMAWVNELLDAFADDHWVLIVDADELFIYPRYEQIRLADLCRFLDTTEARGLFSLMLDMYSDRPVGESIHTPGQALVGTCAYFDRGPYRTMAVSQFPYTRIYGGVRDRLFRQVLQGRYHSPTVSKIPLIKWRAGTRYLASTHHVTPLPLSALAGGLLHFKFLQDFHERAVVEVGRGEHHSGAHEYTAYLELLQADPRFNLMSPASVRFEDSAQLVRLGLMQTSEAYERFANALA
ncbi:glycosyltransferase family 2 protein [Phenylobacterium sp.]|uniref:glycosyltransferase family 2 protein n=1 Tax=Phenylobacterium sp. TaxID=1871053 RepID=UPI003568685E